MSNEFQTTIYIKEIQKLLATVKEGKVEHLKEFKRAKVLIDKLVEEI